jgi:large subunit ribosomal protein L31e
MAEKTKTTELERIYTIPLRDAKDLVRSRRANNAVRDVRRFLVRHMKADQVWLDNEVNETLWARGKFRIPSRIRVRATRFSDGVVEVTLPDTAHTGSVRTEIAERKEKASETQILKAPEQDEAPGHDHPVTDIEGIGPATAEKLEKAEIETVADLAGADAAESAKESGIPLEKMEEYVAAAKKFAKEHKHDGEGEAPAAEPASPAPADAKASAAAESAPKADKAEGDKPKAKPAKKE